MKTLSIALLAVAISFFFINDSTAQGKKRKMPSQEEMMKRWQEAATPGEYHKAMEKFVGMWETSSKTWMGGPDAPPTESKGSCEMKWTMDGRFLQQDFKGEMMGLPFTGFGLTGYDNFKKKYTMFWIDNSGTAMYTGEGTFDGKVMTLWGKMDDPAAGEKDKKIRYVTTVVDNDKHVFQIFDISGSGDKKPVVEITYTRKKL